MKVYQAMYNSCIYESGYSTISLHKSKETAEKAILDHRQARIDYYTELCKDDPEEDPMEFLEMEAWLVLETELLD
jgi:hypothetical protein